MSETTLPDLGSAKVRIVADKSGLKDGLKSAEDDAKKSVARIQESLMELGKGLSASITAPILAIGATAAASMESLNRAMITLRAGTGAVGGAMKGLHNDFLAVLRNADEPVQTIAADMALLNQRTGMTGEGLQTLTEQFQILQKYTGEKPIREVTRVFGDWSVAAEDQVAVLDELYRAYQRTGVSITELTQNVVQYGAPMRVLGFSLHETIALFAKWNMEGVNTVNVMGGLRMMLAKFNAGGVKDAKAAFEGLAEAIRGAKDFAGGVTIANALMGGDKSGAFGVRNTNDTVAAIREGRFELSGLVADLINSNETLKGIDAEGKTLADTFGQFKNALVAAFDPLTKQYQVGLASFGDALAGLAGGVGAVVDWFARLDGATQVAILAIVGIAAATGPVLIGLGGLVALWGVVGASMLAVAGPVAVVVAALGALVLVVLDCYNAWQLWGPSITAAMETAVVSVTAGANSMIEHLGLILEGLGLVESGWADGMRGMGQAVIDFVNVTATRLATLAPLFAGIALITKPFTSGASASESDPTMDAFERQFEDAVFGGTEGANRSMGKSAFSDLLDSLGKAGKTGAGGIDELTGAMGKAQKAAVTLEDALSMRQGARPLEAMTAELKKVMDMAARFPSVIDQETIALLTGKAFESGGGKIPFAAAYDALMLLNPAMAETILLYKNMDEANKQFQDGLALTEETARLEAESMRNVFQGLDVMVEKTKKEMTKTEKVDFFAGMAGTLAGVGGQLERVTGKASGLSKALAVVGGVANMAINAVKAFAAGCAAGGPLVGILNAALSVLFDALGLMASATEKVKTGFDRMTEEVSKKWNEWTDRLTDSIVEFIETGKFAFDDFVKSIAEDLLKIGIKWAIIQPVLQMMGVPSSAFGAKGLVNDGGAVSKFAGGGVVTRPMSFSMGMGLIGEGAKPAEAYVPLTRTRSGDLGVSVEGMATGAKVNVVVNNYGAAPVTKTESMDADGTRNITLVVENIVKKAFARGSMDSVLGSVMGARRTGVQYG
jgi:phage-related minor tail protein